MYVKMQIIQSPTTCALTFFFQIIQHLETKKSSFIADIKFSSYF